MKKPVKPNIIERLAKSANAKPTIQFDDLSILCQLARRSISGLSASDFRASVDAICRVEALLVSQGMHPGIANKPVESKPVEEKASDVK